MAVGAALAIGISALAAVQPGGRVAECGVHGCGTWDTYSVQVVDQ